MCSLPVSEMAVVFGSVRARILRPNMRMRNGMLHIIDRVIYSSDPNASEFTSHGSTSIPSTVVIFLISVLAAALLS